MKTPTVHLRPGREKSARHRHPWIFSGAVGRIDGPAGAGELVAVRDADGDFVGWGHANPESRVAVRLVSWGEAPVPDDAWWRLRLASAIRCRGAAALDLAGGCRLVHGEADGFPGLVIDRYGAYAVLQSHAPGMDRLKALVAGELLALPGIVGVHERSDPAMRRLEGLEPSGGTLAGEAPPDEVEIVEEGLRFGVGIGGGHKTGYYLDQRENRSLVRRLARGRRVLDCFSYTGGFAVAAGAGGAAALTLVDSSGEALAGARANLARNGLESVPAEFLDGDAFALLRKFRDAGRAFDLAVVDPPRLAPSRSHVERAARAYKDVNLWAMRLAAPGGLLVTFSCSQAVDEALFREIVSWAALDAGREVRVLARLSQAADHPEGIHVPESRYLKGLVCHVS
jgi:23S rRNA (cytosine1962-C5)-methyltransferase